MRTWQDRKLKDAGELEKLNQVVITTWRQQTQMTKDPGQYTRGINI